MPRKLTTPPPPPPPAPPAVGVMPAEFASDAGWLIPDLRSLLLELAACPARLKANNQEELFVKEIDRIGATLVPMPEWACPIRLYTAANYERVTDAQRVASLNKLVTPSKKAATRTLNLARAGQEWLQLDLEEQYRTLYEMLWDTKFDHYYGSGNLIYRLFESTAFSIVRQPGVRLHHYHQASRTELQPFIVAVRKLLEPLTIGTYLRITEFTKHVTTSAQNPFLLGRHFTEVRLVSYSQFLSYSAAGNSQVYEDFQLKCQEVLPGLIADQFARYGVVQLARDASGQVCFTPTIRWQRFFDPKAALLGAAPTTFSSAAATKVIVQPDFSVMIIGLNPAPAADLAPFCERGQANVGQGALVYKITRPAIVQARRQGLSYNEIIKRLTKHASTPVPPNVLSELKTWCDWVRTVNVAPVMVIRCADAATADRALGALGKRGERLSPTMVALKDGTLGSAERKKLQDQGILVAQSQD
jgi:hypothetical protein